MKLSLILLAALTFAQHTTETTTMLPILHLVTLIFLLWTYISDKYLLLNYHRISYVHGEELPKQFLQLSTLAICGHLGLNLVFIVKNDHGTYHPYVQYIQFAFIALYLIWTIAVRVNCGAGLSPKPSAAGEGQLAEGQCPAPYLELLPLHQLAQVLNQKNRKLQQLFS